MSVSARCIAFGVLVFLYWVAAFVVAEMNIFSGFAEPPPDKWWNVGWLRVPGFHVGSHIIKFLERVLGWEHADILGWPVYIALFLTAVGMGTGAWLLTALFAGWWLRRKQSLPGKMTP